MARANPGRGLNAAPRAVRPSVFGVRELLTSPQMSEILDAVRAGATGETLAAIPMPATTRAAFVRRDEQNMFDGMASRDKDPRRSLHVDEVPVPELAPDEVYLAVMASSINFNTVWTSIFEPLSTFGFLDRLAKESFWGRRHALDYHIVGSDAGGRHPSRGLRGAQLEGRRRGHGALQLRRRPRPERSRRLDARRATSASGGSRRTSADWPTSASSRRTS